MDFTNKVALVTGAAVGIGRATAILLAQNGAKLVLVDINGEKLDLLKTEFAEYGDKILTFACDVNSVSPGSVSPSDNYDIDHTQESTLSFMGRTGSDRENANLICFLASDAASYISGQNIQIDGCRKKQ